jgi:hypothetical protein
MSLTISYMKHVWLALLTMPAAVIIIGITIGIVLNRPFFGTLGIPMSFGFIPLFSFVISVALIFVFPNVKEWKIAAVINGIPFLAILLVGLLFFIVGYNG